MVSNCSLSPWQFDMTSAVESAYWIILRLTLAGGVTIDTTAEHPFFEESLGWIEARSLTLGHRLRTLDGSAIAVESLAETG
ncbi:unnamed protein product [Tuwongella immobilis]|uniref:Uncharacterized protein n=2 Tax=Tuwongella immobilis TaxID=692036 RepID=A0A6C2YKL5_9BACT|nr:unnamed protein product [Tuwongella immobilis]VTR99047.1 unnamed protein product [Tuwongella immobilis]